jgi:hypothetical protein
MRGKITGPNIDVQVRILSEEEGKVAQELVDVLFQGIFRQTLMKLRSWRKKEKRVILEIT